MNVRKGYQLDIDTIQTLDDVKVILKGLNLTTYPEGEDWPTLQKYFTVEIDVPALLSQEELKAEFDAKGYTLDTSESDG